MTEEKPPEPEPSNLGELTQEEKDKISRWYAKHAPQGAACPICGSKTWAVLEHMVTPIVVGGAKRNSMQLGGIFYPHFMLACTTCGNVQFINALQADVSPKREGEGT